MIVQELITALQAQDPTMLAVFMDLAGEVYEIGGVTRGREDNQVFLLDADSSLLDT